MSQALLKVATNHPLCPEESPSAASGHRELSARSRQWGGENMSNQSPVGGRRELSESHQGDRDEIKDGYFSLG